MKYENENRQLLDSLNDLEEKSPCTAQPMQPDQSERICRMALDKMHQDVLHVHTNERNPSRHAAKRHARRPLRTGLIAAALVCVLAVSVCAAGVTLLPMLAEKIGFFQNAPSQEQVDNALNAPRGEHEGQQALEAFNAAVGQSVTDQGITVTLDNVSMDVSGMDLFLTIEGEEAIEEIMAQNDHMPLYTTVGSVDLFYMSTLNDDLLIWSEDSNDWYRQEDGSIKVIVHSMFSELPEGEELILNVKAYRILDREGNWSITVPLDGASVRAGAKMGTAGVYEQPALPASDGCPEIKMDLDLVYAAFGPRGGVMASRCVDHEITDENGNPIMLWWDGSIPSNFMITDNTGKTLYAGIPHRYVEPEEEGRSYYACDLTQPDPAATSLTLTPMQENNEKITEKITYTTDQLKASVQIPCGPESGFYIQNFRQEGSSFTWQEVPYGYMPSWADLIPEDEDIVTTVDGRFGLIDAVRDPHTGIFNCRLDYYAATPEEVAQIVNWTIASPYYEPMHEQEFIVPLSPLESAD